MSKGRTFPKIYDFDYLTKTEFGEDDLYHLFETQSLNYSIIQEMFRVTGEYTNIKHLADHFKRDNGWLTNRHFKSKKDRQNFINRLIPIIKNVYQYSDYEAKRWVDDWMFHYGFSIKHYDTK